MRILHVILFFSLVQNIFCQDTIFKKSGENIAAKIIEINQGDVKFKKQSNLEGPLYIISKSEIARIRYANGLVDTIKSTAAVSPVPATSIVSTDKYAGKISNYISDRELLLFINNYPAPEARNILKHKYIEMSGYRNTQYLANGLGFGLGFAVPVVFTFVGLSEGFSSTGTNGPEIIVAGAILGAAIRTTGAVIAKVNKNKRRHKKEEILAIFNQLK